MSNIRITDKKRPGGIPVLENIRLNYEEVIVPRNNPVVRKVWDMSMADLQSTLGYSDILEIPVVMIGV